MANIEHLDILKQGVDVWNQWRKDNPDIIPDLQEVNLWKANLQKADLREVNLHEATLQGANLQEANLQRANLQGANLVVANLQDATLQGANLQGAKLWGANLQRSYLHEATLQGAKLERANLYEATLQGANLQGANLWEVNLQRANLQEANLQGANLWGVNLQGADIQRANLQGTKFWGANLRGAYFQGAILSYSSLIRTNLDNANLSNCRIYGISAWDVSLKKTIQSDLIITEGDQPVITVDNLEVAQFIYPLLNNEKIWRVIDTITSKVALILGRFTPERKPVLDAIREKLRRSNYLPVLFDFDKPDSRDFIETVSTLAHLARFVIADFTNARIVLEEVPHIVRNIKIPVIPLLLEGSGDEPVTLYNLRRGITYLLDTHWYKDADDLLTSFQEKVIIPAEKKSRELRGITIG